jgi:hypothetical protein
MGRLRGGLNERRLSVKPFATQRLNRQDLRVATEILEKAAGEAGDAFLQYLYRMAILHLEVQAGIRSKKDICGQPREVDPRIGRCAVRLIAITREQRR